MEGYSQPKTQGAKSRILTPINRDENYLKIFQLQKTEPNTKMPSTTTYIEINKSQYQELIKRRKQSKEILQEEVPFKRYIAIVKPTDEKEQSKISNLSQSKKEIPKRLVDICGPFLINETISTIPDSKQNMHVNPCVRFKPLIWKDTSFGLRKISRARPIFKGKRLSQAKQDIKYESIIVNGVRVPSTGTSEKDLIIVGNSPSLSSVKLPTQQSTIN